MLTRQDLKDLAKLLENLERSIRETRQNIEGIIREMIHKEILGE